MIDSYAATTVIIGFLVTFGLLLPILDKIPKIRSIISFRWTLVVIYSAMCLGVIIDFEHLDNAVRFLVVLGGILLSAIFVFVRSYEKAQVNHWKIPHARASLTKGDVSAEFSVSSKIKDSSCLELDDTTFNPSVHRHKSKSENKIDSEKHPPLSELFNSDFASLHKDKENKQKEEHKEKNK